MTTKKEMVMHMANWFGWFPRAPTAQPLGDETSIPVGWFSALRTHAAHWGEGEDEHYLEEAQDLSDLEHRQRHLEHDGTPLPDQPPV